MKALVIFGTRPEAVKLAPVISELRKHGDIETTVCVTAQHRHMLDQVLELFGVTPEYDLDLMVAEQTLNQIVAGVLEKLEGVLQKVEPDVVIVQGDTSTTLAAALAAYHRKVPVAHVEAGLRTRDKYNPFPEEINRVLVDSLSDYCFVPTEWARRNLLADGFPEERIHLTGNTVVDALHAMVAIQAEPGREQKVRERLANGSGFRADEKQKLILVTGHRRESFGEQFENICRGLRAVAERNPAVTVFYPVHLNPNVRRPVESILRGVDRVHLAEPLDYECMVWMLRHCYCALTDSGGVQEEAPVFGKPVLVMRKVTERPEGVEAGVAKLVGTEQESIVEAVESLLNNREEYERMSCAVSPYGDGQAARRIVEVLRAGV